MGPSGGLNTAQLGTVLDLQEQILG